MADVQAAFRRLPVEGAQCDLEDFPYVTLTHSVGSVPHAHIVAGPKQGRNVVVQNMSPPPMSRSAIFELLLWKDCGKDFQGFGLITEKETGGICMTGLWSSFEGAPFADYV